MAKKVLLITYINSSQGNWEIISFRPQKDDSKNNIVMGNDNIDIIEKWKRMMKIEYN